MAKTTLTDSFTEVGELVKLPDGGLAIRLTFGKALRRILKPFFGKKLLVSFEEQKYQRSKAANRWLWGVAYVTIAAWYRETQGERISKEAIHAYTLHVILDSRIEVKEMFGKEIMIIHEKSTSQMTVQEFSEFMETLVKHWAEKGCEIPMPRGDNLLSDYIDQ